MNTELTSTQYQRNHMAEALDNTLLHNLNLVSRLALFDDPQAKDAMEWMLDWFYTDPFDNRTESKFVERILSNRYLCQIAMEWIWRLKQYPEVLKVEQQIFAGFKSIKGTTPSQGAFSTKDVYTHTYPSGVIDEMEKETLLMFRYYKPIAIYPRSLDFIQDYLAAILAKEE